MSAVTLETAAPAAAAEGVRSATLRLIREKPLGAVGAAVFLFFVFCAVFAHPLAPYGENETEVFNRLRPPSVQHLLGTDNLGRDVLSRLLMGGQASMLVGVLTSALATVISVIVGMLAGYFGGRFDLVTQRMVDSWMIFPDLVLLIVVISVLGPGMTQIIVVLGLLYGIGGSRIIRGAVMSVRENTYTRAAQAIGASPLHILWRHILPNIGPVVILLFTSRIGAVILAEAGLSFLGLGVPPPAATWGEMLTGSGRSYMYVAPWLALAPGICLTLAVFSINIFGDALRDVLDPRMRGSR
ncbi:ABC transporter permease [Phenylobacterium sp.]|jgi:peptide/nickel transport system permease protein|uniref:ABC transporter permease n=1 Tax=Phenylobacterium sp. TaxID=1871053 RepID=UPI002F959D51